MHDSDPPPPRAAPPFFIVGCPRSGTTLLQVLLDAHPALAIPPESFVVERFGPLLPRYGDLDQPANRRRLARDLLSDERIRDWTLDLDADALCARAVQPGAAGLIDALFSAYAAAQGKTRWGDKTPQHALCIPGILDLFPAARIIHLVRDGRDVAESMTRVYIGPATITGAARRWDRIVREVDRQRDVLPPNQFLEVRFEDVIRDPESARRRVFDFLGEPADACAPLDNALPDTASRRQALGAVDHHAALAGGFSAHKIGAFRQRFSPREIGWFESIAAASLVAHGYEPVTDGRLVPTRLESLKLAFQDRIVRYARKVTQPRALSRISKELRLAAQLWWRRRR